MAINVNPSSPTTTTLSDLKQSLESALAERRILDERIGVIEQSIKQAIEELQALIGPPKSGGVNLAAWKSAGNVFVTYILPVIVTFVLAFAAVKILESKKANGVQQEIVTATKIVPRVEVELPDLPEWKEPELEPQPEPEEVKAPQASMKCTTSGCYPVQTRSFGLFRRW